MISAVKLSLLLSVLSTVESGDNPHAWNREEDAIGILQIRRPVIDDVNYYCQQEYEHADAYFRDRSEHIATLYLRLWCGVSNKLSFEDAARIWNGGPDGWWKLSTLPYWRKVEAELRRRGVDPRGRLDTHDILPAWQPPQTRLLPGGLYLRIPGTAGASSSRSDRATSFHFDWNGSAGKAPASTSFTFTIRPSESKPAPRLASRPPTSPRAKTPVGVVSFEFHLVR